jgi:hypothetical protein
MLSPFANQQRSGNAAANQAAAQNMNAGTQASNGTANASTEGAKKSAW